MKSSASSPPPLSVADRPLSVQGRFGRLSFIAWSAFLHFIFILSSLALGLGMDIVNFMSVSTDPLNTFSLYRLSNLFALLLLGLYIYFAVVITIRRLHDLNSSGWWTLLCLLPGVNILFGLYLLLGPGTTGSNRYGPQRLSLVWEKILAWLMIIFMLLGLFAVIALFFYLGSGEASQIPADVMQKTTEYF